MQTRRAFQLFVFSALIFIAGCSELSDPERPFYLIKPSDGWIRMDAQPTDSELLVLVAQDMDIMRLMNDKKDFRWFWFHRGNDNFLLYFQTHLYVDVSECNSYTYEFARIHGAWIEKYRPLSKVLCGD